MARYVRCVFCRTGHESRVARQVEAKHLGHALFPQKVKPFHVNGVWEDRTEALLPGYLFVYSEEPYAARELCALEGVIRVLGYQREDKNGWLKGSDLAFADWILNEDGMIEKLAAVREGSFVRIRDETLRCFQGRIIEINKRRHSAHIVLDFLGTTKSLWLGYELMEIEHDTEFSEKGEVAHLKT